MKTFRIIAAAGLILWLISGIVFGFREILPYLLWMGVIYLVAEIGTRISIKNRNR